MCKRSQRLESSSIRHTESLLFCLFVWLTLEGSRALQSQPGWAAPRLHSQKLNIVLRHTLAEDDYWVAMMGRRAHRSQMSFKAIHIPKGCSSRAFLPSTKGRLKCLPVCGRAGASSSGAADSTCFRAASGGAVRVKQDPQKMEFQKPFLRIWAVIGRCWRRSERKHTCCVSEEWKDGGGGAFRRKMRG